LSHAYSLVVPPAVAYHPARANNRPHHRLSTPSGSRHRTWLVHSSVSRWRSSRRTAAVASSWGTWSC